MVKYFCTSIKASHTLYFHFSRSLLELKNTTNEDTCEAHISAIASQLKIQQSGKEENILNMELLAFMFILWVRYITHLHCNTHKYSMICSEQIHNFLRVVLPNIFGKHIIIIPFPQIFAYMPKKKTKITFKYTKYMFIFTFSPLKVLIFFGYNVLVCLYFWFCQRVFFFYSHVVWLYFVDI